VCGLVAVSKFNKLKRVALALDFPAETRRNLAAFVSFYGNSTISTTATKKSYRHRKNVGDFVKIVR
jgi:hypothetical protein